MIDLFREWLLLKMAGNVRQQLSQLASLSHSGGSHRDVTEKYETFSFSGLLYYYGWLSAGRSSFNSQNNDFKFYTTEEILIMRQKWYAPIDTIKTLTDI